MDREEFLEKSFQTWINLKEVSEIIIVDWSSKKKVWNNPLFINDKVKIIRANNFHRWTLSWAYNLAISQVSYDKVFKVDSDILVSPKFFKKYIIKDNIFYRGFWGLARNENEMHLNGTLFCHLSNLKKVNGYNERILSYGWDDDDLYNRLKSNGIKDLHISPNDIEHIYNEDSIRVLNQKEFSTVNEKDLNKALNYKILKNKAFSEEKPWTSKDKLKSWKIKKISKNLFSAGII